MFQHIKNALRRRRLASAGIGVELRCPTARYGTGGGSWTACSAGIRPDSVVYSVGIGRDLSFDLAMIGTHGVTVHAFDPTPTCVEWVNAQALPAAFVFHEIGLASFDGDLEFHPPRRVASAHFTPVKRYRGSCAPTIKAPVRKLRSIMGDLGHARVDLLKMDIEGGEYDVIDDIANGSLPIGQLLVEFHHNYETIPFASTVEAVGRLRRIGFQVFAISDRTYEVSLLRV